MKLNKKYIIGTHVMFYEIEVIPEFIQSVVQAVDGLENPANVTVDFQFNISEYFEKVDTSKFSKKDLIDRFTSELSELEQAGVNLVVDIYESDKPRTMVDYRRDLNYFGCQEHDFVVWGESDCLIPKQIFEVLETLSNYTDANNIYRYITTFATRKMWDPSWSPLEHIQFTDKQYYEKDNPLCWTSPHSIRYTMNMDEMNSINDKYDSFDIRTINQPQFDGSCLVLSADLIKAGCNIHPGIWGLSAEDTAMMYSCMQILGQNYLQFIVKNILKVHNREHPNKRNYVLDYRGTQQSTQANKGDWYNTVRDLNKENLSIVISNPQKKILSYKDFENKLN